MLTKFGHILAKIPLRQSVFLNRTHTNFLIADKEDTLKYRLFVIAATVWGFFIKFQRMVLNSVFERR